MRTGELQVAYEQAHSQGRGHAMTDRERALQLWIRHTGQLVIRVPLHHPEDVETVILRRYEPDTIYSEDVCREMRGLGYRVEG